MHNSTERSEVKKTTDYGQFVLLDTNRDVVDGHISKLKTAIEEHGNLTKVMPIVVNEHGQVIDGQNRLEACKLTNQPVYYVVVEGLDINDARQMNILHRNWVALDYLKSYAIGGNANYQRMQQLVDDYEGVSFGVILHAANGADLQGAYKRFRDGDFTLSEEQDVSARADLDAYLSITEVIGKTSLIVAKAFFRCIHATGYDHERMLRKLTQLRATMQPFSGVEANLRQFEDIYNYGFHDENRVRLY